MIVVRDIFQCKYGKAGPLVALFKDSAMASMVPEGVSARLLTDLSGQFDTVVSEWTMESMAAWEKMIRGEFENPEFGEWFAKMQELVDSGRREFYTLEGEL
jgi:hypothetical protein